MTEFVNDVRKLSVGDVLSAKSYVTDDVLNFVVLSIDYKSETFQALVDDKKTVRAQFIKRFNTKEMPICSVLIDRTSKLYYVKDVQKLSLT